MNDAVTMPSQDASGIDAAAPARPGKAREWLREPLLHFLVLGALLFAIDHAVSGRGTDPHTIVVDDAVDRHAIEVFQASRGRVPNAEELRALRQRWVDNEVLYREGLALGVDRGDETIRERVIFKALSIIETGIRLPSYNDETLRSWFTSRRAKYDEPARYDFEEAVLSGENSESAVRAFVRNLNAGTLGDANAGLRIFKGRPEQTIVQTYGDAFAKALAQASAGEWQALPSSSGWRAIRMVASVPARPAEYEAIRGVVLQDWTDATMAELRTAAVRSLARKYAVEFETGGK